MARQPDSLRRPILVCYDGSPAAARAVDAAGSLFPGRVAIVLHVHARVAVERVRTTSAAGVRDELIEEVRVAARRDATATAEEGVALARDAGLEARPLLVEATEGGTPEAIVRVAIEQSAAAVVVARTSRTRRALRPGGVLRGLVDRCPVPLVVVSAAQSPG
ncbi:MAG TPA: universal stress protein [Gaiellaceae bacterium]|jgi:nucleotide-binding universal stress UspA family protein|nr:universal stress protein [Gaiellaceae bacterium]